MAHYSTLGIYKPAYELMRLTAHCKKNMRKDFKHTTGSDLHWLGTEIVLQIAEANEAKGRERVAALRVMHKHLDRLKLHFRLCKDEHLVSPGQWAKAIELMQSVGAQGGGWIEATEKTSAA
jgi:hypothetical protein